MANEKRFHEKVMDTITGPKKPQVLITFPHKSVLREFSAFAKENSGDCYWLAIKTLLNFHKEQTEGDVKTIMLMKFIEDTNQRIDEMYAMITSMHTPKPKKLQTFGKPKEEDEKK